MRSLPPGRIRGGTCHRASIFRTRSPPLADYYARSRALCVADLSGAHALAGDTDTAVTVGHQAIDAITALHSPRAYDWLRVLNTTLEPLHTSGSVAELRDRLTTTAV